MKISTSNPDKCAVGDGHNDLIESVAIQLNAELIDEGLINELIFFYV